MSPELENQAVAYFEEKFQRQTLDEEVSRLDDYELAPLFRELYRHNQPVLEAGCGNGKWCRWLALNEIHSDGVDYSRVLCEQAQEQIPESRFHACDMEAMPFEDGAYGGLMALGSVEHIVTGPEKALKEFRRVLRPGGKAVITVPHGGKLRRAVRWVSGGFLFLREIRQGRPGKGQMSLKQARSLTKPSWGARYRLGEGGWSFFEYEFTQRQMRAFLEDAGFEIREVFVGFKEEGITNTFGRVAGHWNPVKNRVSLTPVGWFLDLILAGRVCGHMLCFVVQNGPAASADEAGKNGS